MRFRDVMAELNAIESRARSLKTKQAQKKQWDKYHDLARKLAIHLDDRLSGQTLKVERGFMMTAVFDGGGWGINSGSTIKVDRASYDLTFITNDGNVFMTGLISSMFGQRDMFERISLDGVLIGDFFFSQVDEKGA